MTKLFTEKEIPLAAEIVRRGGLAAFRTETVYGLAANLENADKIFTAKKRSESKHLVIQFASLKDANKYFGGAINQTERKFLTRFKSGLTVVLSNGQAIRIPSDKIARRFLRACKEPLAVTSANISGNPASLTWEQVYENLNGRIDVIVKSRPCKIGLPSTIIKIEDGAVHILRHGAISDAEIKKAASRSNLR